MNILLDLDDVLVDFTGAACGVHGHDFETLMKDKDPGTWGLHSHLGVTKEEFWAPIQAAGEDYWAELRNHDWYDELIALATFYDEDWQIVSTPARHPTCWSGKKRWADRNQVSPKLNLMRQKWRWANKNTVLIDDKPENCELFTQHGGYALLFPQYNNPAFEQRHDPIVSIKTGLEMVKKFQS